MPDAATESALVIKPRISRFDIKKHEEHAFEQREKIQGWRLADKSRRVLADTSHQLDEALPDVDADDPDNLLPWANEFAAISAAGIAIRTGGALLAQVSCGYVVEAGASLRRVIEARLNVSALLADPTGGYGLRFLKGHPSKLATLTKHHGSREEIAALSQLNHADSSTLNLFWDQGLERQRGAITYGKFHVYPQVVEEQALSLLYVASKEFVGIAQAVCTVFRAELEVTPWVRQELHRLDDLVVHEAAGDRGMKLPGGASSEASAPAPTVDADAPGRGLRGRAQAGQAARLMDRESAVDSWPPLRMPGWAESPDP